MTELQHTCANNDGIADVGHGPDDCLACDVNRVQQAITGKPWAMARESLDRIATALAEATRAPYVELPESRWIPVGERMPGDRLAVLAVAHGAVLENSVYRRFGNWYEASTGSSCTLPVSHWMPLPALPKEPGRDGG